MELAADTGEGEARELVTREEWGVERCNKGPLGDSEGDLLAFPWGITFSAASRTQDSTQSSSLST